MEFSKLTIDVSKGKRFDPIVLGALGGYAYYYFIGCASGSCPISSNPWVSTAYGMLIGGVMMIGPKNKPTERNEG